MNFRPFIVASLLTASLMASRPVKAVDSPAADFKKNIQPVLEEYCYDCHGGGENRGGVALDAFNSTTNFTGGRDVWWRVLKNLRAGLMPPAKKSQPTKAQKEAIQQWIKDAVFEVNPLNPGPGRGRRCAGAGHSRLGISRRQRRRKFRVAFVLFARVRHQHFLCVARRAISVEREFDGERKIRGRCF